MTEQARHHDTGEKLNLHHETSKNLEAAKTRAEKTPDTTAEQIESIRQQVEHQAISGREVAVGDREAAPSHSFATHKQLKFLSYKRTLAFVQSRLNRPEKAFSKTIHNRAVERVSNVGAATLARPYGILGGGLAALLGSAFCLYLAKRYGFTYNFSIFVLLFVVGYIVASLLEIVLRIFKRHSA